jgi:2-polyprenyl-3-methyl-5-hydroxy-6-metoxy-1,4-benzoquinol methylase
MQNLLEREQDRYEELIGGMPEYLENSPGEHWAELFMEVTGAQPGDSVLDAGCCSGKGAVALSKLGLRPQLLDITDIGLVDDAKAFPFDQSSVWSQGMLGDVDWVLCADVMEHIPTEFVMLTLSRLIERARKGAFFTISLQPDQFGMFIGQPLHLTVQPYVWWRERLKDVAELVDSRDYLNTGMFLARGRS